jgi:hypothetical protein
MKSVLWERQDQTGLEYSSFRFQENRCLLVGTIVTLLDDPPARVTYRIECDEHWRTRVVDIQGDWAGETKQLSLRVDDQQIWTSDSAVIPLADGLFDIDLEISPVSNTLPIRRLNLEEGESAEVTALWVRFPDLRLERLGQRYTRIGQHLYHYEAPSLDFEAQLEVDDDGLIVHYEGLWRRVGSGGRHEIVSE